MSYNEVGFEDCLNQLISMNVANIWVALYKKQIVGAICLLTTPNIYNPIEKVSDILFIDVVPDFQRKGIAREMIKKAENWCKRNNIIAVSMGFKSQEIAQKMSKYGFNMFEYKTMKKIRSE